MKLNSGKPKAVIISVNYKSTLATLEFLKTLSGTKGVSEVAVVIVDNSSGREDLSRICDGVSQSLNVELLESVTNRGYFGAARFAFDHYLSQRRGMPDWVIVCNPDVIIEDKDFFVKLFEQDATAGAVIAPRIQVMPGGVDQNPFMRRRPGRLRWASLRFCFSTYGIAAIWDWLSRQKRAVQSFLRGFSSLAPDGGGREFIYAPHGAFFIFSRRYFDAGGFIDGNIFLYGEEISVAEICRSLGLAVVYEPSLRVLHDEHSSTGKRISRFSYECQKKALRYIASQYLYARAGNAS